MKYLFLFLLFFLLLTGIISALGLHETIEMEILVIDNDTGMPLPNISVIHMLQKVTGLFVDGTFTIIECEEYHTDENGYVRIPKRRLSSLKMNESIYSEHIFINIDTSVEYESLFNRYFDLNSTFLNNFRIQYFYPNTEYYSAYIIFHKKKRIIYTQINDDPDVKNRISLREYNGQSDRERIIIELVNNPVMSEN